MATLTTNLKCDNCESGIVKLIVKSTKRGDISYEVKKCDSCKKWFGIKSVSGLEQINPC